MGNALIMPRTSSVKRDLRQDLTPVNSQLVHARDDVIGGVEPGGSGRTVLMLMCGAVPLSERAREHNALLLCSEPIQ